MLVGDNNRAAKAAKELDKSVNAKEALRLIELQEQTKQREADARRTEYEAHVKSLEIQRAQKVSRASLMLTCTICEYDDLYAGCLPLMDTTRVNLIHPSIIIIIIIM